MQKRFLSLESMQNRGRQLSNLLVFLSISCIHVVAADEQKEGLFILGNRLSIKLGDGSFDQAA
jgi:hypothetical protein